MGEAPVATQQVRQHWCEAVAISCGPANKGLYERSCRCAWPAGVERSGHQPAHYTDSRQRTSLVTTKQHISKGDGGAPGLPVPVGGTVDLIRNCLSTDLVIRIHLQVCMRDVWPFLSWAVLMVLIQLSFSPGAVLYYIGSMLKMLHQSAPPRIESPCK